MVESNEILKHHMTYAQVAGAFGVRRETVWRWVRDGDLTPIKAGHAVFFQRIEVERLKKSRRSKAGTVEAVQK